MKKRVFAVCDPESSYACHLTEYFHDRQGKDFEVQAFSSIQSLRQYAKETYVDLLLISSRAVCREGGELPAKRVMILSEGELLEEFSEYPGIYKYQDADSLIAQVMSYYAGEKTGRPEARLKRRMEMIGIYSPVRRTRKTSFALALGQILARDKAVLYLNLEDFAGFEGLMGKKFQADLSDLMYFVKQGKEGILYQLESIVQSIGNLDYIPPVFLPGDLRSVVWEEWERLFEELTVRSSYEVILLDMDEQTEYLTELLELCDRIYMPVKEDGMSLARLEQYEQVLRIQGKEGILDRTKKLRLPFHSSFGPGEHYAEQLAWGELGDYIRAVLREEAGAYGRQSGAGVEKAPSGPAGPDRRAYR